MKSAVPLVLALLLVSPGCSYRTEKEAEPVAKLDARSMGFSEAQVAILAPKCSHCHDWTASYEGVTARLNGISARIQSGNPGFMMPPPGRGTLSAEERVALQGWIDRGAPRLGKGGESSKALPAALPPVKPGLHFAYIQQQVFMPKCAKCHGEMVGSYEKVLANLTAIESRVRSEFDWEQMPPPGRAVGLTEEEKNLLLDWVKAGAPEKLDDSLNSEI